MVKAVAVWSKDSCIVLGIDIGATQSAVAFSHLYKGGVASVQRVSQWPGQGNQQGEVKIPTQIHYDSRGEAVRIGAETLTYEALDAAEDEGWHLVKHFKLHLHPDTMKRKHNLVIEALPNGVTLMNVYVDFMRYLLQHTKKYFEEHVLQGEAEWRRYFPSMTVVIAHPNGWGVDEQDFLRRAAVTAGFATSRNASSQIKFVSEAEASVHFCIFHMDMESAMDPGTTFVVCDAGGSTVDTTVYGVKAKTPKLDLEEKKASDCIQAGGIFVDYEVESYLRRFLRPAGLREEDISLYVTRGVQEFEKTVKRNFSGVENTHQIIAIADRYNNTRLGVKRGRLSLTSDVVTTFFKARVDEVVSSVQSQMSGLYVEHILLVGGFGQSLYLRNSLKRRFESPVCQIVAANDGTSKPVADGAVIWHLKMSVTSRAPRFSYGMDVYKLHDYSNRMHAGREITTLADGSDYVLGSWSEIASRGVVIDADSATRRSYIRKYDIPTPDLSEQRDTIYAFSLPGPSPEWLRNTNGDLNPGFKQVCNVRANLNGLRGQLTRENGITGSYWTLSYVVGIRFGGTALEAFVEWDEEGRKCTGEATIIPNSLG